MTPQHGEQHVQYCKWKKNLSSHPLSPFFLPITMVLGTHHSINQKAFIALNWGAAASGPSSRSKLLQLVTNLTKICMFLEFFLKSVSWILFSVLFLPMIVHSSSVHSFSSSFSALFLSYVNLFSLEFYIYLGVKTAHFNKHTVWKEDPLLKQMKAMEGYRMEDV